MATITLRLHDAIKEDLEALARGRGQNLSDLIRSALDDLLLRDAQENRLDSAPRSLTPVERNLSRSMRQDLFSSSVVPPVPTRVG